MRDDINPTGWTLKLIFKVTTETLMVDVNSQS